MNRHSPHHHPCDECKERIECDGELSHNYDGFPETVCALYHGQNALSPDWLCQDCAKKEKTLENIKGILMDVYQSCGPDLGWNDNLPDDDDFAEILIDLVAMQFEEIFSKDEREVWTGLTREEKKDLIFEVGP